jgi:hypothetical protein
MIGCFDSDVLIDYFDGIATAAEELSHYERVTISRITWMEVLVGRSWPNFYCLRSAKLDIATF